MFSLPCDRPAIMGVLNVTPDSFSDGGKWVSLERAVAHAEEMMADGADLVDVGGESTRSGADPVSVDQECNRVLPVIKECVNRGIPISIDTRKAEVASAAIAVGAEVVNDISGLADPEMLPLIAQSHVQICLMHIQGDPQTMQLNPHYQDVVMEVKTELLKKAKLCEAAGIDQHSIWVDPGFGFGKTLEHNLQLLNHLEDLTSSGYPVLLGVSRKSSIGAILRSKDQTPLPPDKRLFGSIAMQVIAQIKGVRLIRTHDVLEAHQACEVAARVIHS